MAGAGVTLHGLHLVYFAQRVSERLTTLVHTLTSSRLWFHRLRPASECREQGQPAPLCPCGQSWTFLSTEFCETGICEVEEDFTEHQNLLHAGTVSTGSTRALGCDLRADLLASRITPERYHNRRQALDGLLRRRRVSGRLLEVVIGHATFVGLMCRPVLSVFNTVYRFIQAHYSKPTPLWETAREELRAFKGLMIFLHADWCRGWNNYVVATDASMTGYGVVSSIWQDSDVAAVGRELERGRFRKLGSHSAREAALTAAGFVRDSVTDEWRAGWVSDDEYLSRSGWGLNHESASEFKGLEPCLWGKWLYPAGILELEARALAKGLRRVALSRFGHDIRQLILIDNMSVCLAFDRSRARSLPSWSRSGSSLRTFWLGTFLALFDGCLVSPTTLTAQADWRGEDDSKILTDALPSIKGQKRAHSETSRGEPAEECCKVTQARSATDSEALTRAFERPKGREPGVVSRDPRSRVNLGATSLERVAQANKRGRERDESPSSSTSDRARGSGQPEEEETGEKGSAKGQKCSKPHNGRRGFDVPGVQCCGGKHLETVQGGADEVFRVWASSRVVPPPSLPGRPPELQSRETPASLLHHRPDYGRLGTKKLPRAWRALEVDTRQDSQGLCVGGLGRFCSRDAAPWQAPHGSFPANSSVELLSAFGTLASSCVQLGEASRGCDQSLDFASVARGGEGELQKRGLRRVGCSGQPLDAVERQVVQLAEVLPPHNTALGLRLPRVRRGLQGGGNAFGSRSNALPNPARWTVNRPGQGLPFAPGGSEARSMACSQKCGALREERATGQDLGEPQPQLQSSR